MSPYLQFFIWLTFLVFGFLSYFFYNKAKQEEKKLLIERGVDPNKFVKSQKKDSYWLTKLGIVLIGLAVGLIIIVILVNFHMTGNSDAIYPAIITTSVGISLIIANRMKKKNNED
jgi:hypothetical protein